MKLFSKEENIERAKQQREALRIAREKNIQEVWENLQPFKTPLDVPGIPVVDKQRYQEYFVPKLIEAGAIPKKDLVDGEYYVGNHRCTSIAKWNEKENKFEYWKWEFFPLWDDCNHFEDDDNFALFVPIGIGTKEEFDKYSYDNFMKNKKK